MKGYLMTVEKIDEETSKKISGNFDKIGGNPTYMPPDLKEVELDYFFMEIYNTEKIGGKKDILCWQFYQDMDMGGIISNVVPIPVGSELYSGDAIKKRRWLDEYRIHYQEVDIEKHFKEESEKNPTEADSFVSMLRGVPLEDDGKPDESFIQECEYCGLKYMGIILEDLCPYNDLNFGNLYHVIGMDEEGNLKVPR